MIDKFIVEMIDQFTVEMIDQFTVETTDQYTATTNQLFIKAITTIHDQDNQSSSTTAVTRVGIVNPAGAVRTELATTWLARHGLAATLRSVELGPSTTTME